MKAHHTGSVYNTVLQLEGCGGDIGEADCLRPVWQTVRIHQRHLPRLLNNRLLNIFKPERITWNRAHLSPLLLICWATQNSCNCKFLKSFLSSLSILKGAKDFLKSIGQAILKPFTMFVAILYNTPILLLFISVAMFLFRSFRFCDILMYAFPLR